MSAEERKPHAVVEYRTSAFGAIVLCDAETSFVEQFMTLDDFVLPFGRWIAMTDDDTGKACLGVWGKRNAKRFRRMLRERGAQFVLVRGDNRGDASCAQWPTPPHMTSIASRESRPDADTRISDLDWYTVMWPTWRGDAVQERVEWPHLTRTGLRKPNRQTLRRQSWVSGRHRAVGGHEQSSR